MPLADNFVFSSNNLQDYLDCPRRFELKYLLKQSWPAVSSQPILEMEQRILQGNRFHLLAQQYLSGMAGSILKKAIDDPQLETWFDRFQVHIDPYLNYHFFCEFSVVMPFDRFRLIAVFDFIAMIDTEKIWIADWKTSSKLPKRENFLQHIQSILYPFFAYEVRSSIFPQASQFIHNDLSMEYWFPEFPDNTISFDHSGETHTKSRELLVNLIAEISNKEPGDFNKTSNEKRCMYCQYRSLCERGIQAGSSEEDENEIDSSLLEDDLDFDQIGEIAF